MAVTVAARTHKPKQKADEQAHARDVGGKAGAFREKVCNEIRAENVHDHSCP
jgi:hypothetical protein